MNDEFEQRLRSLRPAAPPPDLMRRLRAAEPVAIGQRCRRWLAFLSADSPPRWRLAPAGLFAAAILVLAVWQAAAVFSPRWAATMSRLTSSRANREQILRVRPAISGFAANRWRDASFDVGGFDNPKLGIPSLGLALNTSPGGGLPLDAPTGPMRLDCGSVWPGSGFNPFLLGTFDLNGSTHFEAIP